MRHNELLVITMLLCLPACVKKKPIFAEPTVTDAEIEECLADANLPSMSTELPRIEEEEEYAEYTEEVFYETVSPEVKI